MKRKLENKLPFAGDINCQALVKKTNKHCINGAYYHIGDLYLCGVHSMKKSNRKELIRVPAHLKSNRRRERFKNELIDVIKSMQINHEKKNDGMVIVEKLKMMKSPIYRKGFIRVYPNNKHEHKLDGIGCCELSPMRLGPVDHHQKDLPIAKNIENYHQGNKVFPFELDKDGSMTDDCKKLKVDMYKDQKAHRHKYPRYMLKQYGNVNIPKFSVHLDDKGGVHKFTYVQSRYFYSKQYEILANKTGELRLLRYLLSIGINLQIIGYDGFYDDIYGDLSNPTTPVQTTIIDCIYRHYLDSSKPFGHEYVLWSLLIINDPREYPWNKYKRNFEKIYEPFFYTHLDPVKKEIVVHNDLFDFDKMINNLNNFKTKKDKLPDHEMKLHTIRGALKEIITVGGDVHQIISLHLS